MINEKKRNIGIVLGICTLIIMVIGVTYAAFQYTKSGTKENTLTTGTISFKYNETSNGVTLSNAMPTLDEEGKKMQKGEGEGDNGYFDFNVDSHLGADAEVQYYVYAVDVTGEEENKLDPQYVKVYLTDQSTPENVYQGYDEEVPVYTDLDDVTATGSEEQPVTGKLLYQNKFTESGTHFYRLRLWVSNEYEDNEVARTFKMRVDVNTDAEITPVVKDSEKPTCTVENVSKPTIGKDEDVTMTIKCTDDNGTVTSNMTSDNIHVKVDGEDVTPTKKELDEGTALADITGENGIQHNLTLGGFEKGGKVTFTIDSGVVEDQYKNTNDEQTLEPNITVDAEGPVCTLEEYFPTKMITKDKTLELTIQCIDESEITQDLTEEGLKVTVGDEEETELTKEITNTEEIDKGKKYTVEVKGFKKLGKIGATINEGALQDSLQDTNKETILEIDLEIGQTAKEPEDLIKETNPSNTEYSDETKDSMFEIEQPDGSTGYRYIGNTEKNYVNLLGTDDGKTDANLWRIIGVFEEENSEGVKEKRIKLILNERLNNTNYAWDNNGSNGSNNWTRPAAINSVLNGAFLDSISGSCPSGANGATTSCDFTSYKMNTVQSKIETMKWHLGGASSDYSSFNTEQYFLAERGGTVPKGAQSIWNGNVGLMYPSDYGYTFSKGISDNCYNKLSDNNNCTSTEGAKSWIWKSTYEQWTLTPRSDSGSYVFKVIRGSLAISTHNIARSEYGIRPVVYLKSNIGITGGSGTKTDPYTVDMASDLDAKSPTCSIYSITPESPTVEDSVQIKIKCTDDSGKIKLKSPLTKEEIEVKINGADTSATEELSSANEQDNSIEYTLTLNNFDKSGSLSLTIPEGKVTDESGNTNIKTLLTIGTIWGTSGADKFTKEHTNDSGASYSDETKDKMFEFTHDNGNVDYRYIGNTEKNYVNLLGTDEGKTDANLWRIIGVFEEENASGVKDKRIKLILDEKLNNTNYSWDNSVNYGSNNWTRSAALNTTLNSTFWDSTSGKCPYGGSNATTSCDFTSYKMSSVQDKIENMKWHLGGWHNTYVGAEAFYIAERGSTVPNGAQSTWNGNVGLAYPSDYGYTYGAGFGTTQCFQSNLNSCSNETTKSWLFNSDHWWTLTSDSSNTSGVFRIRSDGYIDAMSAYNTGFGVRPVVYLKSNIGITGGEGTKTEPFLVG